MRVVILKKYTESQSLNSLEDSSKDQWVTGYGDKVDEACTDSWIETT